MLPSYVADLFQDTIVAYPVTGQGSNGIFTTLGQINIKARISKQPSQVTTRMGANAISAKAVCYTVNNLKVPKLVGSTWQGHLFYFPFDGMPTGARLIPVTIHAPKDTDGTVSHEIVYFEFAPIETDGRTELYAPIATFYNAASESIGVTTDGALYPAGTTKIKLIPATGSSLVGTIPTGSVLVIRGNSYVVKSAISNSANQITVTFNAGITFTINGVESVTPRLGSYIVYNSTSLSVKTAEGRPFYEHVNFAFQIPASEIVVIPQKEWIVSRGAYGVQITGTILEVEQCENCYRVWCGGSR